MPTVLRQQNSVSTHERFFFENVSEIDNDNDNENKLIVMQ